MNVKTDKPKASALRTFSNYRGYYSFCIEWQKATGEILSCCERTRELGREKLDDAMLREVEMKMLIEQGVI